MGGGRGGLRGHAPTLSGRSGSVLSPHCAPTVRGRRVVRDAQMAGDSRPRVTATGRGTSSGEGDGDLGVAGAGAEADLSAVGGHDRLHEREAEAGAAGVPAGAGRVAAGEPLEGVLGQARREARAVVVYGEAVRLGGHGDRGPGRGVLPSVGEQVGHHLVQPLYVATSPRSTPPAGRAASGGRGRRHGRRRRSRPAAGTGRRCAARAGVRSRAGPAAAGPRPSRSSAPTPPRPCRGRSAW